MDINPSSRKHGYVPVYSSRYAKDPMLIALGDAIRRVRTAQGITQEQLALQSELDRSYVGGVERGSSNVTLLNLVRVASALSLTGSQLLEQAGL